MAISILCPGCQKKLKVKDELAGKRVKCPGCGQVIVVPVPAAPPASQARSMVPSPGMSPAGSKGKPMASVPPRRRVRWPWYVGGGVVALCVVIGAMVLHSTLTSGGNHVVVVPPLQPRDTDKPVTTPDTGTTPGTPDMGEPTTTPDTMSDSVFLNRDKQGFVIPKEGQIADYPRGIAHVVSIENITFGGPRRPVWDLVTHGQFGTYNYIGLFDQQSKSVVPFTTQNVDHQINGKLILTSTLIAELKDGGNATYFLYLDSDKRFVALSKGDVSKDPGAEYVSSIFSYSEGVVYLIKMKSVLVSKRLPVVDRVGGRLIGYFDQTIERCHFVEFGKEGLFSIPSSSEKEHIVKYIPGIIGADGKEYAMFSNIGGYSLILARKDWVERRFPELPKWLARKIRLEQPGIEDKSQVIAAIEEVGGSVEPREQATIVRLNGLPITDIALRHLKVFPKVEFLYLDGTDITDVGMEHLKVLTSLIYIDLAFTQVSGAGLKELKFLPKLEVLTLNSTKITDSDLVNLNGFNNLKRLELGNTALTDAGLEHFKSLPNLRGLELYNTKVTDAGMHVIKRLANLEELNLTNTQLTDAGLEHLIDLTKLRQLQVRRCKISNEGAAKLKRALPNCDIRQ